MDPREEIVKIGGIDVHTWIGGTGDPLLVLHGAGGNRGFTRWTRRIAERYTVWAPTHPGFGVPATPSGWRASTTSRGSISGSSTRPDLPGRTCSLVDGAWTAAELATMNPGAIDRLVLVAPEGLKPERGEILDIFYHSPAELRELNVYDPKTIPEWDELYGRPPTPADLDVAERNREMTARLTWKPYMHNPRLEHFLPRVTNPTLLVWGREDRIVPVVCGEQYRRALRTRSSPCSTSAGTCRRSNSPMRSRASCSISSEPRNEALLLQRDAAPRVPRRRGRQVSFASARVPNRFFDREKAAANYQRYLTEYELADRVGFDGLMINEHHSTPSCVDVGST